MVGVKAGPTITERAQHMKRDVSDFGEWEARKALKIKEAQERKQQDELKEVRSGPTISKNSQRIVKNMNRAGRIEDQLLTAGTLNQQRRKDRKHQQVEQATSCHFNANSCHFNAILTPF